MIRACFSWIGRHFPLLVVAIVYFWSMGSILAYRQAQVPAGTDVVLRIGHWQLEPGVREAFNRMADAYRVQHPRVTIVQDAIPEGTYGQWMTTQLMGGTAPDIIEVGMLNYNIILGYHSRYFVPLTTYVNQPNPYNAGTALEGMPWRKTYKDAMRGSYVEELQEYMTVTLAQFGCRIFYNRDLLKRLTGLDAPPHDYRGFLAVCEKIKSQHDARGRPYTPITSSNYHWVCGRGSCAIRRPTAPCGASTSTAMAPWATTSSSSASRPAASTSTSQAMPPSSASCAS